MYKTYRFTVRLDAPDGCSSRVIASAIRSAIEYAQQNDVSGTALLDGSITSVEVAACDRPVVAVSVESGDEQDRERMVPVIERAAAVFDRWTGLIGELVAMFLAQNLGQGLAASTMMLIPVIIVIVPWAYLQFGEKSRG